MNRKGLIYRKFCINRKGCTNRISGIFCKTITIWYEIIIKLRELWEYMISIKLNLLLINHWGRFGCVAFQTAPDGFKLFYFKLVIIHNFDLNIFKLCHI